MAQTVECTVLFADLRGSTALYEMLGNSEATAAVTQCVAVVAQVVDSCGGRVVKTLGDGLMAVFPFPISAVDAAEELHGALERLMGRRKNAPSMRVQVAIAFGEVIEINGDCFGDAVNVAARLLDHAGDRETLATAQTIERLPEPYRERFRRLDWIHLRGRQEPVEIWRLDGTEREEGDPLSTSFGDSRPALEPEGIRLTWGSLNRVYSASNLPVVLGRSHEAEYCIDDTRVSRLHARVEWQGGSFQVTDLSSNGTYVQFGDGGEVITLRRSSCTLHGRGVITLGVNPTHPHSPAVHFQVIRFDDTVPQPL